MSTGIDTGDTVLHAPTGEHWLVAFVEGDQLMACGWPSSYARLSDCALVTKATPEARLELLQSLAKSTGSILSRYARHALQQEQMAAATENATEAPTLHPETADLVTRFARALAEKLALAEKKYGYSNGWTDPGWMDECRAQLIEHVYKGDPRDVAAYCAFLWHHDERTSPSPTAPHIVLEAHARGEIAHRNQGQCPDGISGFDSRDPDCPVCRALSSAPAADPVANTANLVPGQMHCARCKFQLTRTTLYLGNGTVEAGDSKTEPCPNGCGPLWPVTWEQAARDAWATCETLFERAKAAEDALAAVHPPRLAPTSFPLQPPADAWLFEHDDGRHAVWAGPGSPPWTHADPKWHRVGPVDVSSLISRGSAAGADAERLAQSAPPAWSLPLCDCAEKSAFCQGRRPGVACMARDRWHATPCDEGKCPGRGDPGCCHRAADDGSDGGPQ